jgi:hypothetical protein
MNRPLAKFIHKSGLSPSRVYCILAQLTNSNVLESYLSVTRTIRKLEIAIQWWIWQKYNTHARGDEGPDL